MLQLQYYNHKLTQNQIEKILNNYNIKYNTIKKEIDSKFNSLIKQCVSDIREFLENIEEIANERKKIKEAENIQMEVSILKSKLEEKLINENKMKQEIDILTKENSSLKTRLKIHSNISKSKKNNNNDLSKNNSSILKTESSSNKNRTKFPNSYKGQKKDKDYNSKKVIKSCANKTKKIEKNRYNNHMSVSVEKKTHKNIDSLKSASIQLKTNYSTEKRNNFNKKNRVIIKNKNKKNDSTKSQKKFLTINPKENISSSELNNKKNKTIEDIPPFDVSSDQEESLLTVDDIIDEEIKELEEDEENILSLMEEIKNFKNSGGKEDILI